jgi:two-component system response regulator HydG
MNSGPRLLVVDDEPDICANLCDIFADLGYQVDAAHSGPAALDLVARNFYDVALLDLKMPGMDGVELYRRLKEVSAGTVAIIVTAYASTESARSVLSAGAWQIVSKPVDFSRLLGVVREALDQPLLLLVDDDRDLCHSMWDVMRQQGIRCCLAHSVGDAARMLKERSYVVALVDMRLPGGDGCDVVTAVRELNGATRVVLVTAYRSEVNEQVRKALAQGAHAVCYKPLDIDNLLATMRTFIDQ